MNEAVPTSGKIMLASLAEATAPESRTKRVAARAAMPHFRAAKSPPDWFEPVGIFDSTISFVNP